MDNGRIKKIIDILQWILIFGFGIYILVMWKQIKEVEITTKDMQTIRDKEVFIRIHNTRKIADLEKENKELYDSIKHLSNIKTAVRIKYKYKFSTDTIKVTEFKMTKDSIYDYHGGNDSIMTNIKLKAKSLEWVKVDTEINDKLMLINKVEGNRIETMIKNSKNMYIEEVNAFERKKSFTENIFYGPVVAGGYSPITNRFDMFIGFGVGYNLNSN